MVSPRRHWRKRVVLVTTAASTSGRVVSMRDSSRGSSIGIAHALRPRADLRRRARRRRARRTHRAAPRSTRPVATRSAARPFPMPPRSSRTPAGSVTVPRSRSTRTPSHPGAGPGRLRRRSIRRDEAKGLVVAACFERSANRRVEPTVGYIPQRERVPDRGNHLRRRRNGSCAREPADAIELTVAAEPTPRRLELLDPRDRPFCELDATVPNDHELGRRTHRGELARDDRLGDGHGHLDTRACRRGAGAGAGACAGGGGGGGAATGAGVGAAGGRGRGRVHAATKQTTDATCSRRTRRDRRRRADR